MATHIDATVLATLERGESERRKLARDRECHTTRHRELEGVLSRHHVSGMLP